MRCLRDCQHAWRRRCLLDQHTEYMSLIVPEGLRQKTAEMFFEDFWLFDQPWDFQLEAIPPELQAAIHIWHGTGDRQVGPLALDTAGRAQ